MVLFILQRDSSSYLIKKTYNFCVRFITSKHRTINDSMRKSHLLMKSQKRAFLVSFSPTCAHIDLEAGESRQPTHNERISSAYANSSRWGATPCETVRDCAMACGIDPTCVMYALPLTSGVRHHWLRWMVQQNTYLHEKMFVYPTTMNFFKFIIIYRLSVLE